VAAAQVWLRKTERKNEAGRSERVLNRCISSKPPSTDSPIIKHFLSP
jgi:hypothetical protein